ncbi:MAG: malate synthase [Gaiellales bacterium]|jgi:malate synthase|nr:malate synthase [Gaiellales bacterium]
MTAVVATAPVPGQDELLDEEALRLIGDLERRFGPRRRALLQARGEREERFAAGERPAFPEETRELRESEWSVASAPADLDDRRVELTGPADAKMVINALNSGASVFMCCLEDALSPTWGNVVAGHAAVRDATRRTLAFSSGEGKSYTLGDQLATLVVRPRGWHLEERHVHVDGRPASASLFDFALFLRWCGREAVARGSGPYVYLAKLESRHEAELWNDVFIAAQEAVGLPRGTVRATVLIETITASFELEEILHALREHSAGLNAGRWDYIFSAIKKFRDDPAFVLPDRAAVTMAVPFMFAYTEQLVRACHRRAAHAIGGMAAFIPSRDAAFNEHAFAKVREDKEREAGQGFDGTWVAHPGLVPLARAIFDAQLGDHPNQKSRLREDVVPDAAALLALDRTPGELTLAGVQTNVSVGLRYLDSWLSGVGAAAIDNLMEDAATAEISRAQLWQWIRHGSRTREGEVVTRALYERERDAVLAGLAGDGREHLADAARILDGLVLDETFAEFLTLRAGEFLP